MTGRLVSILSIAPFLGASLASGQTLTLDKASYESGEAIHVIWSGSPYPNDKIGIFRARAVPRDGVSNGRPDLWEYAVARFGGLTFTTPLPPGDYVAHLLQNGGATTLTDGVPFTVTYGEGLGAIRTKVLIGPNDPGRQLADPQVMKEGTTFYITGTYSGAGGYLYSTEDFQRVTATWMEIDTKPWPYPYQHLWAFEIYKHVDGTWHGYAYDFDRKGLYHFVPDPDPATTTFPVLRWKEKELLLRGDYDNRVVHDGRDMYLLTAKGNSGHISVYCHRMLDPGTLDPKYTPHRIMSENRDRLESERRNAVGAMKIHECPFVIRVTAPGGTKYVMSYTVGDYGIRDYKIGFAYSDVLIPPPGTEYTKATKPDALNVWGSGAGAREVVYLTQTQKPSWPNYHAAGFNRPGSGDIVEYQGNYYVIYHAAAPLQMEGMVGKRGYGSGRMTWIMPVTFDFTGPIHTWARPGLPTTGTAEPVVWPSRTTYARNEDIVIHFRNAGQSLWDWVGLFKKGDGNENRLNWKYVHGGAQKVPNAWTWERTNYNFSGSLRFADGIDTVGDYDARLFFYGGKDPAAARCDFKVSNTPNQPPRWSAGALEAPKAIANTAYSHSLAGAATDPEGDALSYSLVSSPTWLHVAENGGVSGTPTTQFAGVNVFTVGVTDGNGDVVEATLRIDIPGPAPDLNFGDGDRAALRSLKPVAWYKLDGNAQDSSGNGLHGTLVGSLTSIEGHDGVVNGAYQFAVKSYIDLSNRVASFRNLDSFTVALWIKGSPGKATQQLFSMSDGTSANRLQFESRAKSINWAYSTDGTWRPAYGAVEAWDPASWYHLVFVNDGGRRRAYVNATETVNDRRGVAMGDLPGLVQMAIGAIDLGKEGLWGTTLALDDVRIWDCALRAAEIFDLCRHIVYEPVTQPESRRK